MAKQNSTTTCHNCLDDFKTKNMLRVLINEKTPHYIILCVKCEKEENRKIPGTTSVPYKPFKSTYRTDKKTKQNE